MTHRNEDIIRFLCNYISPDHQTKEGITPIHAAVKYQNLEALKILAEAGGNLFALNRNDLSPLDIAARNGLVAIVRFIVDHSFPKLEIGDEKVLIDDPPIEKFRGWNKLGNAMILAGKHGHGQTFSILFVTFMSENMARKSSFEFLKEKNFDKFSAEVREEFMPTMSTLEILKISMNLRLLSQLETDFVDAVTHGIDIAKARELGYFDCVSSVVKFLHNIPHTLNFKCSDYTKLADHLSVAIIKNKLSFNLLIKEVMMKTFMSGERNILVELAKIIDTIRPQYEQSNDPEIVRESIMEKLKSFHWKEFGKLIGMILDGDYSQIGNKDKGDGGRDFFPMVRQFFEVTEEFIEKNSPEDIDILLKKYNAIIDDVEDRNNEDDFRLNEILMFVPSHIH